MAVTSRSGRRLWHSALLVGALFGFGPPVYAQAPPANAILDASGFQQNRDYFTDASFEHIDTLSGNVILTFTDLVLPGNAGRDLRFQRTYNSKGNGGGYGIAGIPMALSDSSLGLQGPYPPGIDPQEVPVVVLTSDGGYQRLAWQQVGAVAVSKHFWKYDRAAQTLSMPDGVVCHYDGGPPVPGASTSRRVTMCEDQYSWFVTFEYLPTQTRIIQKLGDNESRLITYDFPAGQPMSLSYDGRTWTYGATVTPPVGPGWQYVYTGSLLTQVTTPRGGVIDYEYATESYPQQNSPHLAYTQVLRRRVTSGTLPASCRDYTYVLGLDGTSSTTTETARATCNGAPVKRIVYTYGSSSTVIASPDAVYDGDIAPLTRRVTQGYVNNQWVDVEQVDTAYTVVGVLSTTLGTLEPATRTVTRVFGSASRQFSTTYTYSPANSGDFHNPVNITESGDAGTRTTVRTYQHLQTPYVAGLPTYEGVSTGGETFAKSWAYSTTGFRQSETIYGITTTFTPDAFGNVRRATKANGQFIEYFYLWGLLKDTVTPAYLVERQINPEGTVASQTQAGRTTSFLYDPMFRIAQVTPPGGTTPVVTTYDNSGGGWVKVTRGSAFTETTVDGFGRPTSTLNSVGVRSRTQYDFEGRVVYEGFPYESVDVGVAVDYDALGRVVARTAPGAPAAVWTYGPGTVTHRDELGRDTVRGTTAFGDPDAIRLTSVVDAAGQPWGYGYDAIGQLRSVLAPDGTTRSWLYVPGTNRLQSETHPESGTTQHTYDSVGRLFQRTDGRGTVFSYGYDGNDRVTTITTGSDVKTFTYATGTDQIATSSVGTVSTAFQYEASTGRPSRRTDTIGGVPFTTSYSYDAVDNVRQIGYPSLGPTASRRFVGYDYDSERRIARIYDAAGPGTNYATGFDYHPSGALEAYTAGNGVVTQLSYDQNRYWPATQSVTGMNGALASWSLQYQNYDAVGNVRALVDSRAGKSQTFTFDALDRLQTAEGGAIYGIQNYTYDPHGNRLSGGGVYTYLPTSLRLETRNGQAFAYDGNGNTTSAPTSTSSISMTYRSDNVMATSTFAGLQTAYSYDVDQWRLRTVAGASTIYTLRGLGGELLTEWANPGPTGQTKDYLYASNRLVAWIARPTTQAASDIYGEMAIDGPPLDITFTAAGQRAYITFFGQAFQRIRFVATYSACLGYPLQIRRPDGVALQTASADCDGETWTPIVLPTTGTYTVFLDPTGSTVGLATLQLFNIPDVEGTLVVDGPPATLALTTPGQRGRLYFDAVAGQRISITIDGESCWSPIQIVRPDGAQLTGTTQCSFTMYEPVLMPVTGRYSLLLMPYNNATPTLTVRAYDIVDPVQSIAIDGPPVPVTLTKPGQAALFSFVGVAGQTVSFRAVYTTSPQAGCWSPLALVHPNGSLLSNWVACSMVRQGPITLPVSGQYTILANPFARETGSFTMQLWDAPPLLGSITAGGSAVSLTFAKPGQVARLSFAGTVGARVSALALVGGGACLNSPIKILKPDQTTLGSTATCGNAFLEPLTLPVVGTYTLVLEPWDTAIGNASVQLFNVAANISGALTLNAAAIPVSLGSPGQTASYTFSATAGQVVTTRLTSNTVSSMSVTLKRPNGTIQAAWSVTAATANLGPQTLTTAGTYTLVLDPVGASTGSMSLRVTSP